MISYRMLAPTKNCVPSCLWQGVVTLVVLTHMTHVLPCVAAEDRAALSNRERIEMDGELTIGSSIYEWVGEALVEGKEFQSIAFEVRSRSRQLASVRLYRVDEQTTILEYAHNRYQIDGAVLQSWGEWLQLTGERATHKFAGARIRDRSGKWICELSEMLMLRPRNARKGISCF